MFVRYKTNERGKSVPVCRIYTSKEHPVRNSMIDRDALWAIRKIQQSGGEAYIVGGSIRDIMLGHKPKDFDIGTSLSPRQVQRLFWNSRIIGKRFRIVHLFFGSKIIEVTTFRSDEENFEDGNNNIYGTIEQDSRRRDFSINSLYYNPRTCEILDFTESMEDFEKKRIRSLIPLSYSFSEDPVRMIRAVKYKVTTGFSFCFNVKVALRMNASNLLDSSTSRLTDEVMKILSSGYSRDIFLELKKYHLLSYIVPMYTLHVTTDEVKKSLADLDERVMLSKENIEPLLSKAEMIYYMIRSAIIIDRTKLSEAGEILKDVFRQIKVLLSPITPSNSDIEKAALLVMEYNGIRTKKRKTAKKEEKPTPKKPKKKRKRSRGKKKGDTVTVNLASSKNS